ncbi:hypothetical protein CONPUDRAFT_48316 [Coniophora puteana RWD-64-598 SS2]|uniref:Uncharacterized protein n=1 Tax=Coniophora puteana (strain RWD-64-598) TaxID=741705 RepID=A0A5M3N0T1_CONPW|nr:uncharacterized protein CONPUDRAFT_48316 [Coniophora puteana RWD-64-598 SS2]EIW85023.1 hypothetical protein CONPUDRAFT_48316 [Coniophora puteana RWD-64-598 SS2]
MSLPAHHTKHLPVLAYPFRSSLFHLAQLDDGHSNGTALWLGAQCLSLYLATLPSVTRAQPRAHPPRAVELGSGIGLLPLALASFGWHVLATDVAHVLRSVLRTNIASNARHLPGAIQARELDWTVPPEHWDWANDHAIAAAHRAQSATESETAGRLAPPFDLIVSSDTLYNPALVEPLLRSLRALAVASVSSTSGRAPPVYVCLERRDPALIDHALACARSTYDFDTERIPHKKVSRALERGGLAWSREAWEGIEIWKLVLRVPLPAPTSC